MMSLHSSAVKKMITHTRIPNYFNFVGWKRLRIRHVAALAPLLTLSACGEADAEVIARAHHNFGGQFELSSYRAEPLTELAQAEALAKKMYGSIVSNIKTPSTIFMCLWRNTSFRTFEGERPVEIFLACNFAPRPVKRRKSLLENAEIFNTVDRATVKAMWKYDNGNYQLTRFDVALQADKKSFYSRNSGADVSQIELAQEDMKFPQRVGEPFQFKLRSQVKSRSRSGKKQRGPSISFAISGTAESIPSWVNY